MGFSYEVTCEIKKFAFKLKQIASILTGVPTAMFEDQEFKKLEMPKEWSMTFRDLLQKLGTEVMRDGLHKDVWVNALFSDYKPFIYSDIGGFEYPSWVITDTRFPNEFNAIKERGGINIRVVRPDMHSLQDMLPSHPSETALDEYSFDYEIINNGTLEDLVEKVKVILIKEGILYE